MVLARKSPVRGGKDERLGARVDLEDSVRVYLDEQGRMNADWMLVGTATPVTAGEAAHGAPGQREPKTSIPRSQFAHIAGRGLTSIGSNIGP